MSKSKMKINLFRPVIPNYIKIANLLPWRSEYVYFDVKEYRADKIFAEKGIRVNFKGDFHKDGEKYVLVTCSINNKDTEKFLEAMEELARQAILTGYPNYIDECKEIYEKII